MKLPLQWKWFLGLTALLMALLLVANVCISFYLPPFLMEKIRADLRRDAILAQNIFAGKLGRAPSAEINRMARELSGQTGLRVTILSADGTVMGESDKPADQIKNLENHLQRPEVQEALYRGTGSATRHSETIGVDLLYVAAVVKEDSKTTGFVRLAMPLHQITQTTTHVQGIVAMASLAVGLAALPLLIWTARRITHPIVEMSQMASRVARGDFSARAPRGAGGELGSLATALDEMAMQLDARVKELNQEKAELAAVLSSMIEGVLVVDAAGKTRLVNAALRQQFHVGDEVIGKTVLEAVRNVSLHEFVSESLRQDGLPPTELQFLGPEERTVELTAARLRGGDGSALGAVIVFHDITRIKKLENTRKEFVANVSHELRTPLAIIKGYVETLLDEPPPEATTAKQFLGIIQNHSRRLEWLIRDLLTISALESQKARLHFEPCSLRSRATAVIAELTPRAQEKSITLVLEIPDSLPPVSADPERLHQVFFNLLDNALKYTPENGGVVIAAAEKQTQVEVCVADNGAGIAPEHLPHLFERFYRVDKARSRDQGGTGLGLSIVKHIVQSHGGRVWAESEIGKGSQFYFTLPRS